MNTLKLNVKIYSVVTVIIYFFTNVTPLLAADAQPIQQDGSGQFVAVADPDNQFYDRNFGAQLGQVSAADQFESGSPLSPVVEAEEIAVQCHAYTRECGYDVPVEVIVNPPVENSLISPADPEETAQVHVVLTDNTQTQSPIYKTTVREEVECVIAPCFDTTDTYYAEDGTVLGTRKHDSRDASAGQLWQTADGETVRFVSGSLLDKNFVIERDGYFYAIQKNDDGTYTLSLPLKPAYDDVEADFHLGKAKYTHQKNTSNVLCTMSFPPSCSGTDASETDYYDENGIYLGKKTTVTTYSGYESKTEVKWHEAIQPSQVKLAERTLVQSLVNDFGFYFKTVLYLMRDGLIKIEVDLQSLSATVHIDPSVRVPQRAVSLMDPLGSNQLPSQINYTLGKSQPLMMGVPCSVSAEGVTDCAKEPEPTYFLKAAYFSVGDKRFLANYLTELNTDTGVIRLEGPGNNRLQSVFVTQVVNNCTGDVCTAQYIEVVVAQMAYRYSEDGKRVEILFGIGTEYGERFGGDKKDVILEQDSFGTYRIAEVREYDEQGNLAVISQFSYPEPKKIWADVYEINPNVMTITRTDVQGNILSTIRVSRKISWYTVPVEREPAEESVTDLSVYEALITFADGSEEKMDFSTLEQLLKAVAHGEQKMLPSAVREMIAALKVAFGEQYLVSLSKDKQGNYIIDVSALMWPSNLVSLSFSMTADGNILRNTGFVNYSGAGAGSVSVDFGFMLAIMEQILPGKASVWPGPEPIFEADLILGDDMLMGDPVNGRGIKLPEYMMPLRPKISRLGDIVALLVAMKNINISRVVENFSHPGQASVFFGYNGVSYLAKRLQEGQVILMQASDIGENQIAAMIFGKTPSFAYKTLTPFYVNICQAIGCRLGGLTEFFDENGQFLGSKITSSWLYSANIWKDAQGNEIAHTFDPDFRAGEVLLDAEKDLAVSALGLNPEGFGVLSKTSSKILIFVHQEGYSTKTIVIENIYSDTVGFVGSKWIFEDRIEFKDKLGNVKQVLELVEDPDELKIVQELLAGRNAEYHTAFWSMWEQIRGQNISIAYDDREDKDKKKQPILSNVVMAF